MKMDKQTQLYVGLGVVAVAGYLIYANNKKPVLSGSDKVNASGKGNLPCVYLEGTELIEGRTSSFDPNMCVSQTTGKSFPVYTEQSSFANLQATIAGNRKGMVGMDAIMKQNAVVKDGKFAYGNFSAQNEIIRDGSFANAVGDNIAPNFFNVQDSKNSFRNR